MNKTFSRRARVGAAAAVLGVLLTGAIATPAQAATTTEAVTSGLTGPGMYKDPTPHYHATGGLSLALTSVSSNCGNGAYLAIRKTAGGSIASNSFNFQLGQAGAFRNIDGPPYTYSWAGGAMWFTTYQSSVESNCPSTWWGTLTKQI
jgi:hypothetical protein